MAGNDGGTMEAIATEIGLVFEPMIYAVQAGPEGIYSFLRTTGVFEALDDDESDRVVTTIEERIADPLTTIDDKVLQGNISGPNDVTAVLDAVRTLFKGVKALNDVEISNEEAAAIGDQIVDYLVIEYLHREHSQVHHALGIVGLIRGSPPNDPGEIRFEEFSQALDDPTELAKTVFEWPENFQGYLLTYYIQGILQKQGVPATIVAPELEEIRKLVTEDSPNQNVEEEDLEDSLRLPIITGTIGSLAVEIVPLPETDDYHRGIAIVPYGVAEGSVTEDLGGGWRFDAEFSAEAGWGLVVQPKKSDRSPSIAMRSPYGQVPGEASGSMGIGFDPSRLEGSDNEVTPLLGTADGGYLGIKSVGAKAAFSFENDELKFLLGAQVLGQMAIDPQGGFLKKILPAEGVTGDFGLEAGYELGHGLYFDGSAKLSTTIPINESIGGEGAKLELIEVYLALEVAGEEADIRLTGAVTANTQLGPISGSVKHMGVHGDLSFPEDRDGNLGPADLDIAFKPPTGVGLSVDDSPGISGGGFLGYDEANERYAATFSLSIGPVEVDVFGLLATRMPDGSEGFSLLISIFGEFPPVQLSFGFTLEGLGGVLGINRQLNQKPLRKAARTGSLNSVLFPDDPAANPAQLISDLRSIYPVKRKQHVFGPMARFGWGSPTLIQLDLGIVLQLPAVKIAILGVFQVGMPTLEMPDKAQIIRLNLAVAGTLYPAENLLSIDASLFDSRVVTWAVKGQMAMRLRWGDKPKFVLSVGGFHPQFEPPDSFPDIERVTISLDIPGGMPSVQWQGYFAITPNTVQAGASFEAKFVAGPARAKGWWSIDTLFQFKPFKFVVSFEAGIEVVIKGFELSVELRGRLQGPSPVEINGELNIGLPGPIPDVQPQVSITLGEDKETSDELPTADVLGELSDELKDTRNWAAQLPRGGDELVSLREIEADDQTVLVHPRGRLSVRQTTVPLGEPVERYGQNRPIHRSFEIEVALASEGAGDVLAAMEQTRETFAPEKYKKMSDSEKMNAPPFKRWGAGREVAGDLFFWGCEPEATDESEPEKNNAAEAELEYESSREEPFPNENLKEELGTADGGSVPEEDGPSGYPGSVARELAADGTVANTARRRTGEGKFVPSGPDEDPPQLRSNLGALTAPISVIEDPTVLDEVPTGAELVAGIGGESE